jgi:hypothetical protein
VHSRLAGDHPTLWLADAQDVDVISRPGSRIIARHVALGSEAQVSDIADGLEMAVGGVGYVTKNRRRRAEWIRDGMPTIELGTTPVPRREHDQ